MCRSCWATDAYLSALVTDGTGIKAVCHLERTCLDARPSGGSPSITSSRSKNLCPRSLSAFRYWVYCLSCHSSNFRFTSR